MRYLHDGKWILKWPVILSALLCLSACSYNGTYRSNLSDVCTFELLTDCAAHATQISLTGTDAEYRLGKREQNNKEPNNLI